MKRGKTYEWIPLWVEKWLWGSTRIELTPAERSVWVDIMALGSKDDGYIRANPSTPYLDQQLAGMLCIDIELLRSSVDKCIQYGKLAKDENGILYIVNWNEYSLTERHKRRVMSDKTDIDVRLRGPVSMSKSSYKEKSAEKGFDAFWSRYPRKIGKQDAIAAYSAVLKTSSPEEILSAVSSYVDEIARKGTAEEYIKHPATFLRKDRWRDYAAKPKMTPEQFKAQHEAELKQMRGR